MLLPCIPSALIRCGKALLPRLWALVILPDHFRKKGIVRITLCLLKKRPVILISLQHLSRKPGGNPGASERCLNEANRNSRHFPKRSCKEIPRCGKPGDRLRPGLLPLPRQRLIERPVVICMLRDAEGSKSIILTAFDDLRIGVPAAFHIDIDVGLPRHVPDCADQKVRNRNGILLLGHAELIRASRRKRIQLQTKSAVSGNHSLSGSHGLSGSDRLSGIYVLPGMETRAQRHRRTFLKNRPDPFPGSSHAPDRDPLILLKNGSVR